MRYLQLRPLHEGIGAPSSGTGTTGAASAEIAHNRPTIRNNFLTARFMGLFSLYGSPGSGDPDLAGIIQGRVKTYREFPNASVLTARLRAENERR
jgi:hypothetical protein